jgi:hypothetical protein
MPRVFIVERQGGKTFRITVPDEAKITFGPWSPGASNAEDRYNADKSLKGTLRVYESKAPNANILAVYSGVVTFRDLSLDYEEKIATEEVRTVWKSDSKGYRAEIEATHDAEWITSEDDVKQIAAGAEG